MDNLKLDFSKNVKIKSQTEWRVFTKSKIKINNHIDYVKKWKESNQYSKIYIGTDSQNHGSITEYSTVIVMYNVGKGAHVIEQKTVFYRINDLYNKLYTELVLSVNLALDMRSSGIDITAIHLDYNPNTEFKSSSYHKSNLGIAISYGFDVSAKPDAYAASNVADKIVK